MWTLGGMDVQAIVNDPPVVQAGQVEQFRPESQPGTCTPERSHLGLFEGSPA